MTSFQPRILACTDAAADNPLADGPNVAYLAPSFDTLDRALSADRHGAIRAIIVEPGFAETARAVIERCWHDATLIVDDSDLRQAA